MWELINANKRRSMVLVVCMFALMLVLGFVIGMVVFPGNTGYDHLYSGQRLEGGSYHFDPTGGFLGIAIAAMFGIIHLLIAYFQGDAILMRASGARKIEKEDHPRLFNVVEEMVIASQLGRMPEVYIIDDRAMNAFAAGRKPENAKVAVTAGLLEHMNRDQLQGVIAHEIAHIRHRDVLFMTLVGVLLGAIVLMSELFLRGMWHSGGTRYSSRRSRDNGGGQALFLVIALVLAILAPIVAQLIYFAVSRRREYLADAGAAVYTRYPEGLASALEELSGQHERLERVSRATAPMFIVNPLRPTGMSAMSLMATHPPTEDRIKVLRSIGGSVSYAEYQSALKGVDAGDAKMPKSLLEEGAVPVRMGLVEDAPPAPNSTPVQEDAIPLAKLKQQPPPLPEESPQARKRDTGDMLRRMNGFRFIPCECGMTIKLPPEWKREQVQCPRCGRTHKAEA